MDSSLGTNREGGGKKAEAAGSSKPESLRRQRQAICGAPLLDAVLETGRGTGVVAGAEARRPEFSGMNLELLGKGSYGCVQVLRFGPGKGNPGGSGFRLQP